MQKHTLFISDLHLQATQPVVAKAFKHFLAEQAVHADALYILGDFFEMWLGDDDCSTFNEDIKSALKKLSDQGVPIYLMRGNRDFLLGKRFAKAVGGVLIPDPTVIQLYGKPVLLMHGDSLCTDDHAHQRFRKFAHNRCLQWLFLRLPLAARRWVGERARTISKQRNQTLSMEIMDVNQQAVLKALALHQVDLMIHGHTHRPQVHSVDINGMPAKRIVLGAWDMTPRVLIYSDNGQFELRIPIANEL